MDNNNIVICLTTIYVENSDTDYEFSNFLFIFNYKEISLSKFVNEAID